MKKDKALSIIEQMPENFQIDQLIEKLIFIENVGEGLNDIRNNNLIDHDEVIKQSSIWLTK